MPARIGSKIRYASPDALFMFGGEDRSTYYPPNFEEMRRWGICVAYDRGAASVERMQHLDLSAVEISGNLALRDYFSNQITEKIPKAQQIEKDRQKIANNFNRLISPAC